MLEAGDQPFAHLNLDSAAHHSQPGVGKEASLPQAKTQAGVLARGGALFMSVQKRERERKRKDIVTVSRISRMFFFFFLDEVKHLVSASLYSV